VTDADSGRRRLFARSTLGLLAAAGLALSGCDQLGLGAGTARSFKGVDITGATYASRFSLIDQHGQPRSLGDFKGKVTVVFFGFTQCPDVCPTILTELASVKKTLGKDGERVQGIFVTIDPARDTPEVLKAYMASFDPGFVALRGSADETTAVAKEFKVFYAKVPGKAEGSYTMDHTAGSFIFDPQGKIRLFVRHGMPVEDLAADIKALLAAG
jgi:protein SCO1/2